MKTTKLKPLALLLSAALASMAATASPSGVVISQVYGGGGNAGATWQNDFVELFNAGGAAKDISGWSIQYSSATGTSWGNQKFVLPAGTTLAAGQYLLIKLFSQAAVGGTFDGDLSGTINLSGASGKIALVASDASLPAATAPSGAEDIVSYGSATPTEGAPTGALSNTTSAQRGNAGCTDTDANSVDFGIATPAPRSRASALHLCGSPVNAAIVPNCPAATAVAGVASAFSVSASDADSRVNSATKTGTWPDGIALGSFSGAAADGAAATQQITVAASVPAGSYSLALAWANDDAQTASCTVPLAVQGLTTIPQIQGSGAQSPLKGQVVTTTGIVTLLTNNGFYLQDPVGDGDPATSDGVFVFTSSAPTVAVGDALRLSATVTEYSVSTSSAASLAAPLTELTAPSSITVLSQHNPLPLPVSISLVQEQGQLERFEGMLVTLAGPLTVQQNYFLARYGQLTIAEGEERVWTPTNVFRPGADALALQAQNQARSIILDDGSSLQNLNPTPYLNTDRTVRAGDRVGPVTGVIDFGPATADAAGLLSYKLMPVAAPTITRANARTARPDPVGGNYRVASANVLNYFTTFTNGQTAGGQTGQGCALGGVVSASNCRGADNAAEFARQRSKLVAEIGAIDADVVGLMEMQNNGNTATQNLVDGLNAVAGAGTYAAVPLPSEGTGSDAIRVAMIYKPGRLALVGASMSDVDPVNNRPTYAQGFAAPNGQRFAVVVNHFKSKSSCPDGSGGDSDRGDLQGCWNATRVAQAQRLLAWLPQVQAAAGTTDAILLGDFNAYAKEDPVDTLTGGGALVDLVNRFKPIGGYSYVFDGAAGRLDHGFGTPSIAARISGIAEWHVNADEPSSIDYNTEFKQPACAACAPDDYQPTPYRSSDHDPLVLGLNLVNTVAGGTSGRDTLVGTPGDDVIEGGAGADTLSGNGGRDVFVYRSILDVGDTITDFNPADDQLDLSALLQSQGVSSADPLASGHITCTVQAGSAVIGLDVDGAAGPAKSRAIVQLRGVASCSALSAANYKF